MLIKGTDVIGLNVFTLDKGEKIEDVDDIIFDPKENKVRALLVKSKGLLSDSKVILLDDIKSIGKDAVIINSEEALKNASDVPEPVSSIANDGVYLTKTKIVTEDGMNLGNVSDIYFDSKTGQVEEIEVSQGGLKNIQEGTKRIKVSDIITVGKDAIIVKGYAKEVFEKQQGGIKGAVDKGVESFQRLAGQAGGKAQQFSERIREEGENLRPKIEEAGEKLKEKAYEAEGMLRQKAKEAKEKGEDLKDETQEKVRRVKIKRRN